MNEIEKYKDEQLPSDSGISEGGFIPKEAVKTSDEARHPDEPAGKGGAIGADKTAAKGDKFGEERVADYPAYNPSEESLGG